MGLSVNHLIQEYGCAFVFAAALLQALGAPVPGTTALIAAALYAAAHPSLPIAGVVACAAGGAFIGTSIGYFVGRWGGEPLLYRLGARLRQPRERIDRWRRAFAAGGGTLLFCGRFITGLRNVAGLVSGASGVPAARFFPVCAAASVAWGLIHGLGYYAFGRALEHADTWVQIGFFAGGACWLLFTLRILRRRVLAA